MDLSKATTVKKASIQKQNFDLRYSHSGGRFQLSDSFYANRKMSSNGLTLHTMEHEGEDIAFLTIRPHEDSVFYKGKEGDHTKDTGFSYSLLVATLEDLGMIGDAEKGFENFALKEIGELDGFKAYQITPYSEEVAVEDSSEDADEPETDLTGEPTADVEEDQDVAPEPVAEAEVEAEEEEDDDFDPFK